MEAAEGFTGFVAIVETGSVSAAARRLDLPRPTLSRQLARLEERLGVRLLHRTTRALTPTAAGQELYRRARRVVEEADAALAAVQRLDDVPRGLLRVSAPPMAGPRFALVISRFLAAWPEVSIEVLAELRHVDLVREGIDVALRGGPVRDPALVARRLGVADAVVVASPAYLEARGVPVTPDDLVDHECILGFEEGLRPQLRWPLLAGGEVAVSGRFVSNELLLRIHAAVAGQGLTLAPRQVVSAELESGRLRVVLEDLVGADGSMSIVYVERAFLEPKVRVFVDHLVEVYHAGGFAFRKGECEEGPREEACNAPVPAPSRPRRSGP